MKFLKYILLLSFLGGTKAQSFEETPRFKVLQILESEYLNLEIVDGISKLLLTEPNSYVPAVRLMIADDSLDIILRDLLSRAMKLYVLRAAYPVEKLESLIEGSKDFDVFYKKWLGE